MFKKKNKFLANLFEWPLTHMIKKLFGAVENNHMVLQKKCGFFSPPYKCSFNPFVDPFFLPPITKWVFFGFFFWEKK